MKFSFDLTWLILLFVILKVTGVIHLSWLWLLLPFGLWLGLCFMGLLLGLLGIFLAAIAVIFGTMKVTVKK